MGGAEGMRTDLPLVSTSPKSSTSLSESELPEARQNLPARFWIGGGGGWTEGDLLAGVLGGMVAGGLGIAQPHDPRIPLDPKKELAELHSSSSVLITRRWLTITTAVTLNVSTYHSYRVKKKEWLIMHNLGSWFQSNSTQNVWSTHSHI